MLRIQCQFYMTENYRIKGVADLYDICVGDGEFTQAKVKVYSLLRSTLSVTAFVSTFTHYPLQN